MFKRILIPLLVFVFCGFQVFTQTEQKPFSNEDIKLIQSYKEEIVKYKIAENYNQSSHYITKLAYIYWNANQFSDAIKYFIDAIECYEITGNKNAKKVIFNNLGMIYSDNENYSKSLEFFQKGLDICKKFKDKREIALGYNNVAIAYSYLEEFEIAIDYAKRSLDIGAELNDMHLMLSCYIMITEYYEKQGNTVKSLEYFNYYSSLQKHLQEEENKEKMKKLEDRTKYAEAEKIKKEIQLESAKVSLEEASRISRERQLQIDLLNKETEIQDLALKEQHAKEAKQKIIIYAGIGILLLVMFIVIIIFKGYKAQQKVNKKLEEKNILLLEQKEKINEQRKLLEHSNKKLEKKNSQILDSISYASRIQEAILPYENKIKQYLPNSFIYYKPRDIVSGDFYWFSEQGGKIFIAEVDCTGHGVPGAFMSMIGNTLLNEIVNEKKVLKPSEILKQLNKGIIYTLNQGNSGDNFQDDGMEVTICCIDKKNKKIQIALANQKAYIIEDKKLKRIEGDIYTIGGTFALDEKDDFTNHEFKYKDNTTLYMFSDGYSDQFGGIKNKKFLISQFEEMLLDNTALPMKDQAEILDFTLNSWRGNSKQIDDILVIGINFSNT